MTEREKQILRDANVYEAVKTLVEADGWNTVAYNAFMPLIEARAKFVRALEAEDSCLLPGD